MAENEAGSIIINIRATAESLEAVAEEAKARLQGIGSAADQTKKPLKEAGKAGTNAGKQMAAGAQEAQMAWVALAAVAVIVIRKIGNSINKGIKDVNAYTDAIRGVTSVLESKGISSTVFDEEAEKVVDEFFNMTAAATAYKNLMLRGFSLEQATATIIRLKDAAAFGRQASLTLSQAVTSATEGLKNENSILVDNAGVTKNVAKMWEEYAKSIGVSVSELTQAQKVQAEYLGIQQETAAMTGDIIKLQDSLSGKMAAAENQAYLFSKAYGEAMTPLQAAGTELKTGFLETLTEIVETVPSVTAGATASTVALVGMTAAVPVITKLISLWKSFKAVVAASKVTIGTMGWIALGVGAIVGIYTAISNAIEKAREAEAARIQSNREAVTLEKERKEALQSLLESYVALSRKQSITYSDAAQLTSIENELMAQYGLTREELDKLVQSTDNYAEALSGVTQAVTGASIQSALEQQAADSHDAALDGMRALNAYFDYLGGFSESDIINPDSDYVLQEKKQKVAAALSSYQQWMTDQLSLYKVLAENQGMQFNEDISQILIDAVTPTVDPYAFADAGAFDDFFATLIEKIGTFASSATYTGAFDTLQAFKDNVVTGVVPTDDEIMAAQEAWYDLVGVDSGINFYLDTLVEKGIITKEEFTAAIAEIAGAVDPLNVLNSSVDDTKARIQEFIQSFSVTTGNIDEFKQKISDIKEESASLDLSLNSARGVKKYADGWDELYKAYRKAEAEGEDTTAVVKKLTYWLDKAGRDVGTTADDFDAAVESMNNDMGLLATAADDDISSALSRIYELQYALAILESSSSIYLTGGADVTAALSAIATLREQLNALLSEYAAAGISPVATNSAPSGGGGGGGGGSKASSAYQEAIDKIEHLKALDQLTYEQELANLEAIAKKVKMTAEDRLDLEERLYDVKKAIAERDAEDLSNLTDAIMTALKERYSAMLDAETEVLNQSRDTWEEWRDHNVSAIEDQIDALDALEQAEDRQSTQDEHLRKIARLEQSLAYEQDGYNQIQLQKQLDAAKEAYQDWLADIAREDEKAALQAQIDAINETADTEIAALDKQQEQIEAYYKERMTQANLLAEAEVELMQSTQKQIVALLAEYAPDYDAAGRTLGERLMEGLTASIGEFDSWFAGLTEKITEALDEAQAASVAAVTVRQQTYDEDGNPVSGVMLNQENNFYTPVETPAEIARRIQQANEDLAEQLLGS